VRVSARASSGVRLFRGASECCEKKLQKTVTDGCARLCERADPRLFEIAPGESLKSRTRNTVFSSSARSNAKKRSVDF
jgi:hypothetical protein